MMTRNDIAISLQKTKCCAFTGHRPEKLGYPESDERCAALKERLRSLIVKLIEEDGVTHFISGMAQGVDMYAAEIVLELKKQYPQITLECAIPYERQAVRWLEALRNRYFSIAERCDQETMLQRQYTPDCLRKRNQYMVDHADIVLAVWNGSPSGTGQTVWYARETGKPVWIFRPDTLEVDFCFWQELLCFLILPEHLSVSFADSSPQGEPSPSASP